MKKIDKKKENKRKIIDLVIKIVLIIIIILLLIHNCVSTRQNQYKHPNGNVDIIDIKCEENKCENKEIQSISFSQKKYSVKKSESISLIVLVQPSSLASELFAWTSSNPSIATVDSNGIVHGIKEGIVTITVTSANGKTATCTVEVVKETVKAKKINLKTNKDTINAGSTIQIIATVEPENATDRDLVWTSSDPSIATVDSKGVVKGLKAGTVTITARTKDGQIKATKTITIENAPEEIESLRFAQEKVSIKKGDSIGLDFIVEPSELSNEKLTWTSSDSSTVSVDSNGVVKGLKAGKAIITITSANGKNATCIVEVKEEIESLSFAQENVSVKLDDTLQLIVTVKPSDLAGEKLTWTSSDSSIVSVDSNGVVKGLKVGKATITVTSDNGKTATCTVEVTTNTVDVEEIKLTPDKNTISPDSTTQIIAEIEPENATNREIVWESSDPSIATVDDKGVVKGIRTGTVTITARTKDGRVVASTTLNIKANPTPTPTATPTSTPTPTPDNDDGTEEFKVYDKDKTPVQWNGSNDLKIFSRSMYDVEGTIAPESENTYEFIVKNSTKYQIKYEINFIETNDYNINMKYKLKKNDTYVVDHYVSYNELNLSDQILNSDSKDTYYLEWKWISSSNDTEIGANPEAKYELKIDVKAESVNE